MYQESIENIAIRVATLYFAAISTQSDYLQSLAKSKDLEELYKISQRRLELGTITKGDLLQLELSKLNAKMTVNEAKVKLNDSLYDLFSYLRVTDYEHARLLPPENVPDMVLDVNDVLLKAKSNSSYAITQDLELIAAQQNLAKAKSAQGIQMHFKCLMRLTRL